MEPRRFLRPSVARRVAVAAFAACACSLAPVLGGPIEPGAIADGTYEGDYRAFPDHVWVEVEIADGGIAECAVTKTRGVLKETGAETEIPRRIVAAQSTDVDAISGATQLSRAIMNAAEAAITQAKPERPAE
jgi:fumarate reductase flavoprotein subunit